MDEEKKEVIQEEVVKEQQVDTVLPDVSTTPPAQALPNSRELNFRELRAAKVKAEREREELAAKLAKYEQQQQPPQRPVEDDINSLGDDDLAEAKHVKALQKQLNAFQQQQREATDETRLKTKYNDFDKVVTKQAIDALKDADPEFAETIAMSSSSLYSRGSSTYRRIKELGIYVEDTHVKNKDLAQTNAAKPKPMNAVSPQQGDSPLSMANAFANGLTDDIKRQLWKEMQDISKKH